MRREPHPLWDFSLRVYQRDGVQKACLALQDSMGVDVNVLLFCCWAGLVETEPLGAEELRDAVAAVKELQQDVISPLRQVRRRLQQALAAVASEWKQRLRRQILAVELDGEYVEQLVLREFVSGAPVGHAAEHSRAVAARNLESYFALLGRVPDEECRGNIETLLDGAVSG